MRAILVRVREDDDLVVLQVADVEVLADAGAQRRDHRAELLVEQHLIQPLLLHVQRLAPQRKDRLEAAVAALLGAATCGVALDDEQLVQRGVPAGAAGQLAHQRRCVQLVLLAGHLLGLAHGLAHLGGLGGLLDDLRGELLVLQIVQIDGELLVAHALEHGAHLGVAQLALGLALKLGILHARVDDGGHALAEVVAGEVVVLLLQDARAACIVVEGPGHGGLEARLMAAALGGGHVVDKGADVLRIGIRILNRHAHQRGIRHLLEHDGLGDDVLVRIQIGQEVSKSALVAVLAHALLGILDALIGEDEAHALVQVGQLPDAAAHRVGIEIHVLEHPGIGLEGHLRAPAAGVADLRKRGHRTAGDHLARLFVLDGLEALLIVAVIAVHVHHHPLGQRVHHRSAHAVQSSGVGVVLVGKLAACVELGVDDLHSGHAQLGMDVHRDAAPVVRHLAGAVLLQRHADFRGIAVGGLVDRIVHDLPDQVVQAAGARGADVHARAHAHRVQALQDGDIGCGVRFRHFFLQ